MNQQKILIRLPNWLGDMVMSTAFVQAVAQQYPGSSIDVIAKKDIAVLLDYFPSIDKRYFFSKNEYEGLSGAWKFGKQIAATDNYDLFFCLPESFSSAVMAKATGAKKIIGYKKEWRSLVLSNSYHKKQGLHRVEEYIDLLSQFTNNVVNIPAVRLSVDKVDKVDAICININSEASSRRLPKEKAISIISKIRKEIPQQIILIGGSKEKEFVEEVYNSLYDKGNIENLAGSSSLPQLIGLLSRCKLLLTTDSGPAHLANALGTATIVLFGAGNENNTAPYNNDQRVIIRLGKLPCEPCVKNTCKLYGVPECLLQLDENTIIETVKQFTQSR